MEAITCMHCRFTTFFRPSSSQYICIKCKKILRGTTAGAGTGTSQEWIQRISQEKNKAKPFCRRLRWKLPFNKPPRAASFHDEPRPGRRALVCGVSYKKQKHELKRTALCVRKMRELLLDNFHFPPESLLVLAEEDSCPPPTRRNIEEGFRWLARGISPGDSLLFYFSGHGKREEATRNEIGETICPVDFEETGMIADNFINRAIVKPLVSGVKLHTIVDSCHVGTILDLPRVYEPSMSFENRVDNHINHAIVRRPPMQCVKLHTIKGGTILDLPRVCDDRGNWEDNSTPSGAYKGTKGGNVVCFSVSKDYQLTADATIFSSEKEFMSITLINAIKESIERNEKISYQGIMDYMYDSINQACKSGGLITGSGIRPRILQGPLLSSTEDFNISTEFKL